VSPKERLLIVLTTGLEDGGRKAALAFGVALSALSNGGAVNVFLTLESAVLGTPTGTSGVHPRGFSEPLSVYIEHFLEMGGQLEVCSSCFEEYCRQLPKDDGGRPQLRAGTTIHGLGIVAERAAHMPVLSF
jgi:predicted peroxiredoxin